MGWRYKAVGRGVMRCGLWQTAQEKDREGSPLKVCLIAIALHWPLQVTLFRSQGLHGHQAMAVDLWCPALYLFPGLKKIRYTRKKILQRWQQLTRHRVAMAVRGKLLPCLALCSAFSNMHTTYPHPSHCISDSCK